MAEHPGRVDAHLHLWDPAVLEIGWLKDAPALARPILEDEYARAAKPLGIDAAVIVEAAVDDEALEAEFDWMRRHLAGDGPVVRAVAGWRPAGDRHRTIDWLDRLAETPGIAGVREVMHPASVDSDAPSERARVASADDAGSRGLVVDLCVRPDQLPAAERLVAAASETIFVLDHLGRPRSAGAPSADWRGDIERVARHPNVFVKISALIECAEGAAWSSGGFTPFVEVVLGAFGARRAIWGSNWPVCVATPGELAGWVDATESCLGTMPEADRRAVLGDTARRVYRLPVD